MQNEKTQEARGHLEHTSPIHNPGPLSRHRGVDINRAEDFMKMSESLRQAQSDADLARMEAEHSRNNIAELRSELEQHQRRTRRSGWFAAVLGIGLAALGLYAYLGSQDQSSVLSQVPILNDSFQTVSQRLGNMEGQLRDWAGNWDALAARVTNAESAAASNLRASRDFTVQQTAKVQQQMQDEMNNRTRAMETRLAQTEAAQRDDRAKLAALQQDLGEARTESAQQLARVQEESGEEFSNLRREVGANRNAFDSFARHQEQWRSDFEVVRQQRREVAPGLTLTVSKVDVSRQQLDGWLQLVSDGKILWLRQHGIHQPMMFRNQRDDQTYELVFTRVTRDGAIGYVLLPRYPSSERNESGRAGSLPERAMAQ